MRTSLVLAVVVALTVIARAACAAEASGDCVVVTVRGDRVSASLEKIEEGRLWLATQPPRAISLDEVQSVELNAKTSAPKASSPGGVQLQWMGQDNNDFAQASNAAGRNGIQDIHLRLLNVPHGRSITQVAVTCQFSERLSVWRLNPSGKDQWRLAVARTAGAQVVDLYVEPASSDAFQQDFKVAVTFDDQSTAEALARAATHTSNALKLNQVTVNAPPAPVVASAQSPPDSAVAAPVVVPAAAALAEPARAAASQATALQATIYCERSDTFQAGVVNFDEETLQIQTTWNAPLKIPLLRVLGIRMAAVTVPDAQQRFEAQLAKPGPEDVTLVLDRDRKVTSVTGHIVGVSNNKVRLNFDGEVKPIFADRVVGFVFAAHPPLSASAPVVHTFYLEPNGTISGTWKQVSQDAFEIETPWQESVSIPRQQVREIAMRSGKVVYLSDLEPASVEEVPYFGRSMPYRRDQSLSGGRLKMKDKQYQKGLAMHSRCVLNYSLGGQYETFLALVGFDDSAGGRGNVICRVLADGQEVFSRPALRGDQDPVPVEVGLAGARQLALEVDFGQDEDIGDRVIWADARLLRAAAK